MLIPILATGIRLIWIVLEYPYLRRHRVRQAQNWDRYSAKLWDFANLVEPLGMALGFAGIGRIQFVPYVFASLGLLLLIAGIVIRWTAVYTLGKYFTCTVVIKSDHQLVRKGLYKHVRHPAYTGTLLAHLGLGLCFSNWFSLVLSSVPYFLVAWYRMRVEEQALACAFGCDYAKYCKTTKRLIPLLY